MVTLKARLAVLETAAAKSEQSDGPVFLPVMGIAERCAIAPIQQAKLVAETRRLAELGGDQWAH